MQRSHALIAALLVSVFLLAQSGPRKGEQTEFGAEGDFEHPVALPAQVLHLLQKDADAQGDCAYGTFDRVDATWFSASEIVLKTAEPPALVVRGEKGCFIGANIVEFRVYRKKAADWTLIFTDRALGLSFLKLAPGTYRKIETFTALQAGRRGDTRTYIFRNGKYDLVRELSEEVNP